MYIMLNLITGYAPGLALHIISRLTFNAIHPSDIPFYRQAYCHSAAFKCNHSSVGVP